MGGGSVIKIFFRKKNKTICDYQSHQVFRGKTDIKENNSTYDELRNKTHLRFFGHFI